MSDLNPDFFDFCRSNVSIQDRTWQSTCTMGREGSGSCIPGEAWLGMYTRGLQPDVKCFKIYQCLVVEGRGEKLREEL